jgi:DNA-binding XRE family transcriptional regulator
MGIREMRNEFKKQRVKLDVAYNYLGEIIGLSPQVLSRFERGLKVSEESTNKIKTWLINERAKLRLKTPQKNRIDILEEKLANAEKDIKQLKGVIYTSSCLK